MNYKCNYTCIITRSFSFLFLLFFLPTQTSRATQPRVDQVVTMSAPAELAHFSIDEAKQCTLDAAQLVCIFSA